MASMANTENGDNNAYELQHNRAHIQDLAPATLKRDRLL